MANPKDDSIRIRRVGGTDKMEDGLNADPRRWVRGAWWEYAEGCPCSLPKSQQVGSAVSPNWGTCNSPLSWFGSIYTVPIPKHNAPQTRQVRSFLINRREMLLVEKLSEDFDEGTILETSWTSKRE